MVLLLLLVLLILCILFLRKKEKFSLLDIDELMFKKKNNYSTIYDFTKI